VRHANLVIVNNANRLRGLAIAMLLAEGLPNVFGRHDRHATGPR